MNFYSEEVFRILTFLRLAKKILFNSHYLTAILKCRQASKPKEN